MKKIAIILFPGLNCEAETRRAVNAAGMIGEYFRWNDDAAKLADYDGFIIPGGFSYEDRVRSGAIAARDPLMLQLKTYAAHGKPVLGICNGAQIIIESGLIPGVNGGHLAGAAAEVRYPGDDDPIVALLTEVSIAELIAADWWLSR